MSSEFLVPIELLTASKKHIPCMIEHAPNFCPRVENIITHYCIKIPLLSNLLCIAEQMLPPSLMKVGGFYAYHHDGEDILKSHFKQVGWVSCVRRSIAFLSHNI